MSATSNIERSESESSSADGIDAAATREALEPAARKEQVAKQLGALPVVFIQNDGQWPDEVKFGARGHGVLAAFTGRGITLSARVSSDEEHDSWHAVALQFVGPDRALEPKGERKLPGVHNYFLGNDPSQWHTSVPLFEAVRYDEIAPGVAMVVTDREGKLEYDLLVEPGADLSKVQVACSGADSVAVEPDGSLVLETQAGTLRQSPPKAWYELASGEKKVADCRVKLTGAASFGFEVVDPDPEHRLVVDPGLTWSTFLGGTDSDIVTSIDFESGKVTAVGYTSWTDPMNPSTFPVTGGAFDTAHNLGGWDAFVSRLDPVQIGTFQLVWSTFIGGSDWDEAMGVSVAANGDVAACGWTLSTNFPVSPNGFQKGKPSPGGSADAFVIYVNSAGNSLLYGTYYGGGTTPGSSDGPTCANAVKVDGTPQITFVGFTIASNLPLASAYDTNLDSSQDAFVGRFDPNTGSLAYATYIGGSLTATDTDEAFAVALDGPLVCIGGHTFSSGFHTTNLVGSKQPFSATYNGVRDGFLVYVNPSNPPAFQLQYATFLGGSTHDTVRGVASVGGIIYACGATDSLNFPVSVGPMTDEAAAFQSTRAGSFTVDDAFITKIDRTQPLPPTKQLRYSTYLGGDNGDVAFSIERVTSQAVVVVGLTTSSNFPVGSTSMFLPYDTTYNGNQDAFLTRLHWYQRAPAAQLDYSTFVGGVDGEQALSLALSGINAYFGGFTSSSDYPTAGNPYDSSYNGGGQFGDGFVSRLELPMLPFP